MTRTQKGSNINVLNQELDSIIRLYTEACLETQRLFEEREKLNEQFKKLRRESKELRAERDKINDRVQALKSQRNETRDTSKGVAEEIKAAMKKMVELKKKTSRRSCEALQEEFEEIEWRIQTSSLDLKEEKELIDKVRDLEIQINAHRKVEKQAKRISELQRGLTVIDETCERVHTELFNLAQKSQDIHQRMVNKITEGREVKDKADALHRAYLLSRGKLQVLDQKRRKLTSEKWEFEQAQRRGENMARKEDEKKLREKLEAQAREKLQNGEKLSWDEFQLLAGEDDTKTQD